MTSLINRKESYFIHLEKSVIIEKLKEKSERLKKVYDKAQSLLENLEVTKKNDEIKALKTTCSAVSTVLILCEQVMRIQAFNSKTKLYAENIHKNVIEEMKNLQNEIAGFKSKS